MSETVRGADVLLESLVRAGVRKVFTLSGNHIMPVFDAAFGRAVDLIHVRHEAAAVHMADAWARLTGERGVALVTGGAGHANTAGALCTALASESPVVLLSGHAALDEIGLGAFQELRQADMVRPATKAAWTARTAAGLGDDLARAFAIARSGRPGPVHLSLPFDLLEQDVGDVARCVPAVAHSQPAALPLGAREAQAVHAALAGAARPLILAPPALCNAEGRALMRRLQQATDVPVIAMESPRGINDPCLGAFAEVLAQADLIVLLAKQLDFTLRFGRSPPLGPDCRWIVIEPEAERRHRTAARLKERLLDAMWRMP